ncbi:MAG: tetratricopeptide repeat protein [Nocardioides sp.]|nr:tetratricopeptide repeat protein [Nocardioides sp.]
MAGRQEPFGEQLRRHREAAGFSQEQLAAQAGLSANAIGALERGERKRPYPDTLRRLAEALGLDEDARASWSAALRPVAEDAPAVEVVGTGWNARFELPGEPTPIIGRDRELDLLCDLLRPGTRVLTLVGPGGVGKTRLALSLARRVADQYADGAVWVELAPLTDHTLVLASVGRAIGLHDAGGADLATTLRASLRHRQVLLVLDNMEHLLGAVPDLAQLLLSCPGLHLLTTSRAPLRLRGEQEYHVPSLQAPPAEQVGDEREVAAFPAVDLFVSRAQQKDPSFALAGQHHAVATICRRLDGMPLALELVAARTRTLTPAEILTRLDDPLTLLVGGSRDLPERQQTMRAAIAWSEQLLDPAEQTMLRRLAVFTGGWTLTAAEAVCGEGLEEAGAVLDLMDVLVEQSLVAAHPTAQGMRYLMLEPVRQYACERLAATGESAPVRQRHARYFVGLAEEAGHELEGRAGQASWVERLDQELDNLRGALGWGEETPGEEASETILRLAAAPWRFWEMRWQVEEGRRWLSAGLARSENVPPDLRAMALNAAGNLARDQADHDQAVAYHEQCLAIRRSLGDTRGIASSLNNLGVVARDRGDAARTLELCQEAFTLFRDAGDHHGAAIALISLGHAATQQGDLARARTFYEGSLARFRPADDHWHTAWVLTYLAEVLVFDGDLDSALRLAEEALRMHREGGDPWGVGSALVALGRIEEARGVLDGAAARYAEALSRFASAGVDRAAPACVADLAGVALARGDHEVAARLAGASRAWQARTGMRRAPLPQTDRSDVLDPLAVGPHSAAWQAGAALSREQVLLEAAAVPVVTEASSRRHRTKRAT